MSLQAVPAVKTGNQFFDELPNDAVRLVFEYLKGENGFLSIRGDDKSIIVTSEVCRNWRDNTVLREEERQAASIRLHHRHNLRDLHEEMEYPREIFRIFRDSHTPISQLPVLGLDARDQLPQLEKMVQPVMKFRGHCQRPGVAVKIRAKASIFRRFRQYFGHFAQREALLVIFKYSTDPESKHWVHRWGNNAQTIEELYILRHKANGHDSGIMACPTCPFGGNELNPIVLASLLNRQDPDFRIPGHHVRSRNQPVANEKGLCEKIFLATTRAAVVVGIAYFASLYLISE